MHHALAAAVLNNAL